MLGNIACDHMAVAFWALTLGHRTHIEALGAPLPDEGAADWIIARYVFAGRGGQPPVTLVWWDHPKRPPGFADWKIDKSFEETVLFIGADGMLATDYAHHQLLPAGKFKNYRPPT